MAFFDLFRGKQTPRPAAVPVVRGKFDAAERGDDYKHWSNADAFAADAALSPSVRRTMRNRARYERANNSYLAGISATLANDLIGTGPREPGSRRAATDKGGERRRERCGHRTARRRGKCGAC